MTDEKTSAAGLQQWVDSIGKPTLEVKIVLSVLFLAWLIGTGYLFCCDLVWEFRLLRWEQVSGVMISNRERPVRNGKNTKQVSEIAYQYQYRGKTYISNRILYGLTWFPSGVRAGDRRRILVNPEDPSESAAMIWFRKPYYRLYDYIPEFFLLGLGSLFTVVGLLEMRRRKITVPETFHAELKSLPERFRIPAGGEQELALPPEDWENGRGWRLPQKKHPVLTCFCFVALIAVPGIVIILDWKTPVWGLLIFGLVWLFCAILRPFGPVLDFQEKKLFFALRYWPGKIKLGWNIAFADLKSLHLIPAPSGSLGDSRMIMLHAIREDGISVRLGQFARCDLAQWLEFLPQLAQKLGGLPIYCMEKPRRKA